MLLSQTETQAQSDWQVCLQAFARQSEPDMSEAAVLAGSAGQDAYAQTSRSPGLVLALAVQTFDRMQSTSQGDMPEQRMLEMAAHEHLRLCNPSFQVDLISLP